VAKENSVQSVPSSRELPFKLLPTGNYDPNDEHWEFVPGSIVRAKEVRNVDGTYLLAVAQKGS
jgi:hypothetical protein